MAKQIKSKSRMRLGGQINFNENFDFLRKILFFENFGKIVICGQNLGK